MTELKWEYIEDGIPPPENVLLIVWTDNKDEKFIGTYVDANSQFINIATGAEIDNVWRWSVAPDQNPDTGTDWLRCNNIGPKI
jgi:hypothetical protein